MARSFADMNDLMECVVFEARGISALVPTMEFSLMVLPCGSHRRRQVYASCKG
jgi:hypothetical protein